jgi:hypothetical protein
MLGQLLGVDGIWKRTLARFSLLAVGVLRLVDDLSPYNDCPSLLWGLWNGRDAGLIRLGVRLSKVREDIAGAALVWSDAIREGLVCGKRQHHIHRIVDQRARIESGWVGGGAICFPYSVGFGAESA